MSKRPISVCSRGSASAGGSPTRRSSSASSSVSPSGADVVRRVRHERERGVARGLGGGELLLGLLQRRLDGPQRLELLGCRLALELRLRRGARRRRGMSARQRSSASSSASNSLGGALARERGAPAVGVARAALRSITRGSLESARALLARDRRDVRRDVCDLLLGERAREGRHAALAVRHAVDDELDARLSRRRGSARRSRSSPRRRACGSRCTPTRREDRPCRRPGRPRARASSPSRSSPSPWSRFRSSRSRWSRSRSSSRSPSVRPRPRRSRASADCSSSPPQPAAARPSAATRRTRRRAVRRIGAILYTPHGLELRRSVRLAARRPPRAPFSLNATKISLIPRESAMIPT